VNLVWHSAVLQHKKLPTSIDKKNGKKPGSDTTDLNHFVNLEDNTKRINIGIVNT
jgi:hypothetical protein